MCVCVLSSKSEMMQFLNQDTVQGFCDQCHKNIMCVGRGKYICEDICGITCVYE